MEKDPLELLIHKYFNSKNQIERRKAEVKLLINYPNSKVDYEDPTTKRKYKIIIKDKVTVIPYLI